jgi:hypothetical protein
VTQGASTASVDGREQDRLAILRELEAGMIEVAEAERRLSQLDAAPPRPAWPGEPSRMTALAPTQAQVSIEGFAWVRRV